MSEKFYIVIGIVAALLSLASNSFAGLYLGFFGLLFGDSFSTGLTIFSLLPLLLILWLPIFIALALTIKRVKNSQQRLAKSLLYNYLGFIIGYLVYLLLGVTSLSNLGF